MESIKQNRGVEPSKEDGSIERLRCDIRSLLEHSGGAAFAIELCGQHLKRHGFDESKCAKNGNVYDALLLQQHIEQIFTIASKRNRNKIRNIISISIFDARHWNVIVC